MNELKITKISLKFNDIEIPLRPEWNFDGDVSQETLDWISQEIILDVPDAVKKYYTWHFITS